MENHEAQFDEQLRLIMADDLNEALEKAQAVGQEEDTLFVNADDETVQWKFTDIAGLYPLGSLKDGMEIYSSTAEPTDARRYITETHQRAADIMDAIIPGLAAAV